MSYFNSFLGFTDTVWMTKRTVYLRLSIVSGLWYSAVHPWAEQLFGLQGLVASCKLKGVMRNGSMCVPVCVSGSWLWLCTRGEMPTGTIAPLNTAETWVLFYISLVSCVQWNQLMMTFFFLSPSSPLLFLSLPSFFLIKKLWINFMPYKCCLPSWVWNICS